MPKKNEAWGIEVGQYAIKAVHLSRHGSEVHLDNYEVIRFKQILTTPDIDVAEQIQVHLDKLIQKYEIGAAHVVVSVPGHKAFARFAKLPPVEAKKIPDIVKFEAVQQIPFPIDQVEWDYQVFQQEDSPDVEVGIFAITKERVAHFLSDFRAVNTRIDALTLSPLAVYNAFAFDQDAASGEGTMYMDIGTVSTDLIIVEHGGIWLRTLPIGGNNFTEALVRAFKISYPKAEKLKREAATSKYAKQIFQAMRGVFADLVQEVQRSLGYYQSLNRDADITRLVGVGSTFRLPGLSKFLKQQLKIDVSRPDGYAKIGVEGKQEADFAEHALNLATAYGLALQGLGLHAVDANILPSSIIRSRQWKAKQPWLVGAAACVAVAAGLMGGSYFMARAEWMAEYDPGGMNGTDIEVKRVLTPAQKWQREVNQIAKADDDPRHRIENLQRTLDYRNLWPMINQDIAEALEAVGTQPELMGNDQAQIDAIPFGERRRLYIESIESRYLPTGSVAAGSSQSPGYSDMPGFEEGGGATSTGTPGSAGGGATYFDAQTGAAPRIRIVMKGWTPFAEPSTLLDETFVKHLRKHKDRPGRPYRLEFGPKVVTYLTGRDLVTARDPNNPGGGAPDLSSIDALLPANPLKTITDPTTRAFEFHLEWEVVLRPPLETRSAKNAAPATPPAEQPQASGAPDPAADTADTPAAATKEAQS